MPKFNFRKYDWHDERRKNKSRILDWISLIAIVATLVLISQGITTFALLCLVVSIIATVIAWAIQRKDKVEKIMARKR